MKKRTCAVIGVGPGIGAAVAARFAAGGHPVALCARDEQRLLQIAAGINGSRVYRYDVRDTGAAGRVFAQIRKDMGPVAVLVYNAGAGAFANIDDATLEDFQSAWEVNCRGLFLAVKAVLPDMRAAGSGNIVVTGATASIKGGANFVPFASAKAAQRSLAQSLARHLGPQRIHVSYVIVDGVVDLERTRERMPGKPDEFFMDPAQIAESMFFLTQQPSQAWTFELDLRPFAEKW
ncbi:MAG: SDR family NAD(P)-dependent oxidoreductase [Gammaproteobacteria bacterium]|nr:SDR family NAD(P)-dependent oxidoreductase [Gammaproteobacteria bacterium]